MKTPEGILQVPSSKFIVGVHILMNKHHYNLVPEVNYVFPRNIPTEKALQIKRQSLTLFAKVSHTIDHQMLPRWYTLKLSTAFICLSKQSYIWLFFISFIKTFHSLCWRFPGNLAREWCPRLTKRRTNDVTNTLFPRRFSDASQA